MTDVPATLVSVESEAALLGAMMIDNDIIGEWAGQLSAGDFHEPLHRRIYNAMLRFQARGAQANAITLRPIFSVDEAAGRGEYLGKLVEQPAVVTGAKHLAAQLVQLAARRKAHAALAKALAEVETDFETPIAEITGRVEDVVFASEAQTEVRPARSMGAMIGLVLDRDARIKAGAAPGLTNALISDLDTVAATIERQHYVIIAGRPGMGKTSLALSGAAGYALSGHPGLYLLAEGSEEQMAMRMAADLSFAMNHGISHDSIKKGELSSTDLRTLADVQAKVDLLPLEVRDVGACKLNTIWSEVSRAKARWHALGKELEFVVIDHIGLLEVEIDGKLVTNDRERVNHISRFLNAMKKRLNVAVIALAQLSRAVESREDKRPRISDLRDSGNLEQDADTVILVYREEYYLEQEEPKFGDRGHVKGEKGEVDLHEVWEKDMQCVRGRMSLIGGKTRHGQRLTRMARFYGQYYAVRSSGFRDDGYDEPLLV